MKRSANIRRSSGVPSSMPAVSMPKRFSAPVTGSDKTGRNNPASKIVSKSMGKNGGIR